MTKQEKIYKRTINGFVYNIKETSSCKWNGSDYYKVKRIEATDENGTLKRFIVSRAQYWNEFSSIRSGIISKFEDKENDKAP